ncbi:MAG: hypothetical protein WAW06_01540 [bacterium]
MSGAIVGGLIGAALGVAGGVIGASAGYRRAGGPRERSFIVKAVVVTCVAAVLAVLVSIYAAPAYRVAAAVALGVIAFLLNRRLATVRRGESGRRGGAGGGASES